MLHPQEPLRKDEKEDEEEKEEGQKEEEAEPSLNLHLIWDYTEMDDIDDDVMEEACVANDYNLQSKCVLKYNNSPSTSKTVSKRTLAASTCIEKYQGNDKEDGKNLTVTKSTISMYLTWKIVGDLKLDYDVLEYLKNMKANITRVM